MTAPILQTTWMCREAKWLIQRPTDRKWGSRGLSHICLVLKLLLFEHHLPCLFKEAVNSGPAPERIRFSSLAFHQTICPPFGLYIAGGTRPCECVSLADNGHSCCLGITSPADPGDTPTTCQQPSPHRQDGYSKSWSRTKQRKRCLEYCFRWGRSKWASKWTKISAEDKNQRIR